MCHCGTDESIFPCAPTGTGKTHLAMFIQSLVSTIRMPVSVRIKSVHCTVARLEEYRLLNFDDVPQPAYVSERTVEPESGLHFSTETQWDSKRGIERITGFICCLAGHRSRDEDAITSRPASLTLY
ncbi:uncharacterized protein ARMOST_02018 [Armillaria ostoyae]|uniref:Uncharacterized protein n=1 Tax=Armillaria ostoyae TaxID=47428 RepID=A0A284QQJ9_ARMOS|nr:uncharacterized protein ARMOST_02018 [Armillaria ostoyae]